MATTKKKRRRTARPKQLELDFTEKTWGGYRPGSGAKKKPKGEAGVPHEKRPEWRKGDSLIVTLKLHKGLPILRNSAELRILQQAFREVNGDEFRVVHYVAMSDHLHLIVEATDTRVLSSVMGGLGVRLARRLNKLWGRKGSIFRDRFHANVLDCPSKVRNALRYVLANAHRHGIEEGCGRLDNFSSAAYFDGWKECRARDLEPDAPIAPPRTFYLRGGWRRAGGLLSLYDRPA